MVGTLPSSHCTPEDHIGEHGYPSHYVEVELWICTISGQPVSGLCPQEFWEFGVMWMAPNEETNGLRCLHHEPHSMSPFPNSPEFPGLTQPGSGLDDDNIIPEFPWDAPFDDPDEDYDIDDLPFYLPEPPEQEELAPNLPAESFYDDSDLESELDLEQLLPPTLNVS